MLDRSMLPLTLHISLQFSVGALVLNLKSSSVTVFCLMEHRELNIGIVTYSPLGRGFFAGKAMLESLPPNNFLVTYFRDFVYLLLSV